MSTIKSRLKRLEKSHSESEIVIILSNSLEMEDGSIGNSPYAFSRILNNGMKIIFADDSQDYQHLL